MISEITEQSVCSDEPGSKPEKSTQPYYIDHCDVGLGVFASRDISPGEVILEFGGPVINFTEAKARGARECMVIQIADELYIDTQAPGVYVNHSCSPNCGIRNDRELAALTYIRKGDEVRYDYSTTMEEKSFTMRCCCGSSRCRKVVDDFSTLPTHVQQEYLSSGIVMSFIVKQLSRRGIC